MTTKPWPHEARPLTPRERRREDLWSYLSPKIDGVVDVLTPLGAMSVVGFEFDPNCIAFVPRPRTLEVGARAMELDFWTRSRTGVETYWLIVPNGDTDEPTTSRRVHRNAQALLEAADAASLPLKFAFEHEVVQRHLEFKVQRSLLGYVQDAMTLPNRQAIAERLRVFFSTQARASIDEVCFSIAGFARNDICTVVARFIHRGALRLANPRELTRFSVVEWRADYADA